MNLEIKGTISSILPMEQGQGKNGPWRKQDFILQTGGDYPKQICCTIWGDNIDAFQPRTMESVTVSIDLQSREYNGRWYTDVKAWKITRGEGESGEPGPAFVDQTDDPLPF